MRRLQTLLLLLGDPVALRALLMWPKFSATSYFMMSALARQGISPKTVLDVGANVGQFAVAAGKLFPQAQIHSFEPLPECVGRLKENVANLGNVKIYPIALGDSEGEVRFYVNRHSHSSSMLQLTDSHRHAFPGAQESGEIKVSMSTLDKVFSGVELKSPCLLKLDIQGYEVHALRGGVKTLAQIDYVILETSFKPMYDGEVLFLEVVSIMKGYGFHFLRPVGWLSDPKTGEILQMDALFTRNAE